MPTTLAQIVALSKGVKDRTESAQTRIFHETQKTALFNGLTRTYAPRDDDGERLPAERQGVQLTADGLLAELAGVLTRAFDLEATKDRTNQEARADVIVGGHVLLQGVPATTLLYLEKQLVRLRNEFYKLPMLSPEVEWSPDESTGLWRSAAKETVRTKKTPRNHVKAEATAHHPAQVEMYFEDTLDGYWTQTLFSGAVSAPRRAALLRRVQDLSDAVKVAREEANTTAAVDLKAGQAIFDYLLAAG
jgi:hypothetical protein